MVDGRAPPAQPIRAGRSLKIERLLDVATQTADRFVPSAVRVMVCPVVGRRAHEQDLGRRREDGVLVGDPHLAAVVGHEARAGHGEEGTGVPGGPSSQSSQAANVENWRRSVKVLPPPLGPV